MNYPQIHRILLVLSCAIGVAAVITAAIYFGVLLQAGLISIAIALFWIAWEVRSLIAELRELMQGFVEGYQESLAANHGHQPPQRREESTAK